MMISVCGQFNNFVYNFTGKLQNHVAHAVRCGAVRSARFKIASFALVQTLPFVCFSML
jgi:hypothetical protein